MDRPTEPSIEVDQYCPKLKKEKSKKSKGLNVMGGTPPPALEKRATFETNTQGSKVDRPTETNIEVDQCSLKLSNESKKMKVMRETPPPLTLRKRSRLRLP